MRQLIAFTKKEFMEARRTGRFLILTIIFILLGIMNPLVAKLTPLIMKEFSDSFEETGIIVTEAACNVDALTSWTQYFKNIPMGLIVFLLMFSGIIAFELQKGTFVNMITKGMIRKNIILSKTIVLLAVWTVNYWLCFFITYIYNAYYWDNSIAKNIFFAAFCVYMFGVWLVTLLIMMSTVFSTASAVLVSTGGAFFVVYMLSMIPDLKKFLPIKLMDANNLLSNVGQVGDYAVSLGIISALIIVQISTAITEFNRKVI